MTISTYNYICNFMTIKFLIQIVLRYLLHKLVSYVKKYIQLEVKNV